MTGLTSFEPAEIAAFAREWEALFDRGDHARMSEYYADDAQLIGSGLETVVGRPAIARFWETACRGAGAAGVRRAVRVEAADRDVALAALRGTVELRRDGTTTTVRYVTLWRRDATGAWRIAVDISSPSPATADGPERADVRRG